ncbi:G-type lectin S-receptor-like serine/threonine-protein kinase At1g11330 [Papaver somniferum]|uniref:G-type lectin S-receptor-like serine/threonine-protein kinase At1g11330 n=1 Tax=Papaver somniferum TaxID=3469 RepID=UPI000E6F965F|nr:G-type lectin S-receptor-like serine/threonine-protein kinase At1g11330 [Papaver somniferum]
MRLFPSIFTLFFLDGLRLASAAVVGTTITATQFITNPETIISSKDGIFRLGFFSLADSCNRYVGIWYNNIPGPTIVWVANRDHPANDSSGVFKIASDGNLVVLDGQGKLCWTTNVTTGLASHQLVAELLDTGNLVLRESSPNYNHNEGRYLWQSFDHPTNTLLPGMQIGGNLRTGEKKTITSWRNEEEFIGLDHPDSDFKLEKDYSKGTVFLSTILYEDKSALSRIVLESDGKSIGKQWHEEKKQWLVSWSSDIYNKCGAFGIYKQYSKTCSCMRGFEPKFINEWKYGDWSGGCSRRKGLQCEIISSKTGDQSSERRDFIDARETSEQSGFNLHIRVASSELDDDYGYGREPSDSEMLIEENTELRVIDFKTLAVATNNFSEANKLGQGGFGSVYKGMLHDGQEEQEIAVKRLSKNSEQGSQEFMVEVLVISKLQHRNLVRLLGCCTYGEEKMLIYEYMPNKSLDAFLFDPKMGGLFDWKRRFEIILGIGRGILYLRRDSRLTTCLVIHRDLKASNILLDEELNPKILDFGMARIFGSSELLQANTRKVAGTFGYISPEYVMEGRLSEKSDVFSSGVLLLEIVSGKKNSSLCNQELSLRLLAHAWQLWNENNALALVDPTLVLSEPCFEVEILRCIHVGLLCVEEFAIDRPTMATTLSMLTGEFQLFRLQRTLHLLKDVFRQIQVLPGRSLTSMYQSQSLEVADLFP